MASRGPDPAEGSAHAVAAGHAPVGVTDRRPGQDGPRSDETVPASRARSGLDWFSFFVANLQTGFGPFVSVYLTAEKWTQVDIGLVLTIGGLIGLFGQVPGGALVDSTHLKRLVTAISVILVGVSGLMIASSSIFPAILAAWMLHAAASCTITPAINAMSLGIVGHRALSRRLGRNASFASIGNAVAAAAMGACGFYLSNQSVFLVTAALAVPALFALFRIPAFDPAPVEPTQNAPGASPRERGGWRVILSNRALLILTVAVVLFHLANGAILPLLASTLTKRAGGEAPLLIAACIVIPQILVAILSPAIGARAAVWGRRPLFLIAFAALALRAALLGWFTDPLELVAVQVLDGVSAATLGVVVPTAVADVTRGSGRYALALGVIGTGLGIGASISTTLGGFLSDTLGTASAFYGLAICAGFGLAVAIVSFPETGPGSDASLTEN